jgi:hypothetical protein
MNKTRLASTILFGAGLFLLLAEPAQPYYGSCTSVTEQCHSSVLPDSQGNCCVPVPSGLFITGHAPGANCQPTAILQSGGLKCGVTGIKTWYAPLGIWICVPSTDQSSPGCGGDIYTPLCQLREKRGKQLASMVVKPDSRGVLGQIATLRFSTRGESLP